MKGKISKTLGIMAVVLLILQIGIIPCSAQEKIKLKLSHLTPTNHPVHRAAELFKKMVEESTSGQVEITIFPASTYAGNVASVEENMRGTLDMNIMTPGAAQTAIKQLAVCMLPFAIDDQAHANRLWSGPALKRVQEIYEKNNMKIHWPGKWGFRQMSTSKKLINTPADLKGMKMRVPPEIQLLELYKACGANTATISFSEFPLAIAQGVVDGQCNPICIFKAANLSKFQPFMMITNHAYQTMFLSTNLKTWNKLPPKVQAAIEQAEKVAMNFLIEDTDVTEKAILNELPSKGTNVYEITKANHDKFAALMGPAHKVIANYAGQAWFDEWLGYVEKARQK